MTTEQFEKQNGKCRKLDDSYVAEDVYNPIGVGFLKDHRVCGQYCQSDYNCFSYQYTPNTDGAGECLIFGKQQYIGNIDSEAEDLIRPC